MLNDQIKLLHTLREEKRNLATLEKDLNQRYETLKKEIIQDLDNQGIDSVKTQTARVTITESEAVRLEDWDAFWDYVKTNNASHLLQKRPASTACKELQTITGETPPGLSFITLRDLSLTTAR